MNQDEKTKVKVDTVVGMINGGMATATGAAIIRKLVAVPATKAVAGITAGALGRTAAATTLTAVACPAVITVLTVGSVLFGICSIVKAFNN